MEDQTDSVPKSDLLASNVNSYLDFCHQVVHATKNANMVDYSNMTHDDQNFNLGSNL